MPPPSGEGDPNTTIFWLQRHRQSLTNMHYFNFVFKDVKMDFTHSHQTISLNEAPYLPYNRSLFPFGNMVKPFALS